MVVQARVPAELADSLASDIEVLGLSGVSEAIRESLLLLHEKARLTALGVAYDTFYEGQPAPVSEVTAALYPDLE